MRSPEHSVQGNASPDSWARVMRCSKVALSAAADSLRSDYVEGGGHVVVVNGATCRTAEQLFSVFAATLSFPDYFGHNWDAFDECLSDLLITDDGGLGAEFGDRDGVPARHLVIIIADADRLLDMDQHSGVQRCQFVKSLRFAASGRGGDDLQRGVSLASMTVVFHSLPEAAGVLADWLNDASVSHLSLLEFGD